MLNEKKTIEELLKVAQKENKKTSIPPRKFERTEDGKIILDPNKQFDKEWFNNDEAFDVL